MSKGNRASRRQKYPEDLRPCCANCRHTADDPDGLLCLEALQITLPRCCCPRWRYGGAVSAKEASE